MVLGWWSASGTGRLFRVRKIGKGVLPGVSWYSSSIREYGCGEIPGGAPVYQIIRVGGLSASSIYLNP